MSACGIAKASVCHFTQDQRLSADYCLEKFLSGSCDLTTYFHSQILYPEVAILAFSSLWCSSNWTWKIIPHTALASDLTPSSPFKHRQDSQRHSPTFTTCSLRISQLTEPPPSPPADEVHFFTWIGRCGWLGVFSPLLKSKFHHGRNWIYSFLFGRVAFIQIFMDWDGRKGEARSTDLIVGLMESKTSSHDHSHICAYFIDAWDCWYSVHVMGLVNKYLGRSYPL